MVDIVSIAITLLILCIFWFLSSFFDETGGTLSERIFGKETELEKSKADLNRAKAEKERKLADYIDQQLVQPTPEKEPDGTEVIEEEKSND